MENNDKHDLMPTTPTTPADEEKSKELVELGHPILDLISGRRSTSKDPVGPLWHDISGILRRQGIYHLPQALTTVAAMVSAHVGLPLALFISADQGVNGTQFLTAIESLIHPDLKIEFSRLDQRLLYQKPDLVKGKAIIVYDVNALKGGKNILQNLLERGLSMDHKITKEQGISQVGSVRIEGPTAVVALTPQNVPDWLKAFPSLKISLNVDRDYIKAELARRSKPKSDIGLDAAIMKVVAVELERLHPVEVDIPFIGQIYASLD